MSTIIDVADALVVAVNGAGVVLDDEQLVATRKYVPIASLESLAAPLLTIVPKSMEIEIVGRGQSAHNVQIDIALQRRIDSLDQEMIDETLDAMDAIEAAIRLRKLSLPGGVQATWIGADVMAWNPVHLKDYHVVTTLLTVTYRVYQG